MKNTDTIKQKLQSENRKPNSQGIQLKTAYQALIESYLITADKPPKLSPEQQFAKTRHLLDD